MAAFFLAAFLPTASAADVREGLVSYWPLDEPTADFLYTEDVVTGNDLLLAAYDFQAGQRGNALFFDGFTGYAYFVSPEGVDTGLPISDSPQFTVTFWVNGPTAQPDRRMFSESSNADNDPLFNIGTHSGGTTNTVDIYIRNSGVRINHANSVSPGLNGEWHHIAWTDNNGEAALYIDGELDSTHSYTRGPTALNLTSIGAIFRQTAGSFFTGGIDEVAVWERVLTQAEIQDVMDNGIQTPVPAFAPTITGAPQGETERLVGDTIRLSVNVTGTRPFTFQWEKDGEVIAGADAATLVVENVQEGASGEYTVVVTNDGGSTESSAVMVTVTRPELGDGLVSHWPLDEITGSVTPDLVSGYDMQVNNLTAADIVTGQFDNAFSFANSRQTLLSRVSAPGEKLPVNQYESFTISMWTMVNGPGQNDLRIFSEGSTTSADPLFNLGTDNAAAGTAQMEVFLRQSGWTTVDHVATTLEPFDGEWHHIAFVQREGVRSIYIDGVLDGIALPDKPAGTWNVNTTTIGGILRASPSHWVTGLIDDVAIWDRALIPEEIALVISEGVPLVDGPALPLEVRGFTADFPAVVQGDNVTLRWEVTKDETVTIDQGIGDVTANTESGFGSITVPVSGTTTYTITVTRGEESVSEQFTVQAVSGVASGWRLLENFETLTAGQIAGQAAWKNPDGIVNVVDRGANQVLGFDDGDDLSALALNSLTVEEGEQATLFFRAYVVPEQTTAVAIHIGLTEKSIRFIGDFNSDIGPYVRFERLVDQTSVDLAASTGGFYAYSSGLGILLEPGTVYNIWIDVANETFASGGDIYSVYLAEEGATERTLLFQDYVADRNEAGSPELGPAKPDLDHLLAAAIGAGQGVNTVLFDDFYLSGGDTFLSTVPIAASPFEVVEPPTEIEILTTSYDAQDTSFTLSWGATAGTTYNVLKRTTVTGTPTVVGTVDATSNTATFTDEDASTSAAFYQIEAP